MSGTPNYLGGEQMPDAAAADEGKAVVVAADGTYELTPTVLADDLAAITARLDALEAP